MNSGDTAVLDLNISVASTPVLDSNISVASDCRFFGEH